MAITIRTINEHLIMLDELALLTGKSTMSKSLIEGGYLACKFKNKYEKERKDKEGIQRKYEELKRECERHFSSMSNIKNHLELDV